MTYNVCPYDELDNFNSCVGNKTGVSSCLITSGCTQHNCSVDAEIFDCEWEAEEEFESCKVESDQQGSCISEYDANTLACYTDNDCERINVIVE